MGGVGSGRSEGGWAYFRESRRNIYIALEDIKDLDFFWDEDDVLEFDRLWDENIPFLEIVDSLNRSLDSVYLLAIDRIIRNKIKIREGWNMW